MDPYIERANLLLQQGRVNDAITQVKSALAQNPDNDEALAIYARCHFDKKQFDEGINILRNAIALDPNNHYYFYLLAFGYYRKNQHAAAIEKLQKAITINPFFAESYGLLSHVYSEEKDFETALKKANEGLAFDPENITCLNARSVALNKLKRTDDAIETMQYALAQDPENDFTHITVAWNYLEKGKHAIAANHFKEALRINPDNANARRGLKEALKSKIAPYRWLLQYSFWMNNKGKRARWIIPLGLYISVRAFSTLLEANDKTHLFGGIVIGLYLLFALTTWIINPLANFFLLFHKDGKYAVNSTEKWTALTVVGSLLTGILLLLTAAMVKPENIKTSMLIAGAAFCIMALPLGNMQYPFSFGTSTGRGKVAAALVALGIITVGLSFINPLFAMGSGLLFIGLLVISSWVAVFR